MKPRPRAAAVVLCLALTTTAATARQHHHQNKTNIASIYSHDRHVACGGHFDPRAFTAAHRSLPCGTLVEVRRGSRRVAVTINDRGPYVRGRVIDLTPAAAKRIGFTEHGRGLAKVALAFPFPVPRPAIDDEISAARRHHHHTYRREVMPSDTFRPGTHVAWPRSTRTSAGADYRPHAWCGWWLRQQLGIADRNLNRAIMWARWGRPAGGPHVGAIVVWPHHVGRIVGPCNGSVCLIESGNDGRAVRTRERSVAGAVAFRVPG